jgi:CubicO group peptidase (beta-lactamase class C family)
MAAVAARARWPGLVDVDAPVEKYWPEFGQNGKGNVLVRHLLSHTAGLPAWEQRIEPTDVYNWNYVTDLLAQQSTWWEPGSKSGYHGLTQGNLVGEVVRRVDGRSVGRFFADEIARPVGADFHIGLSSAHDSRVALSPPPPMPPAPASVRQTQPSRIALTGRFRRGNDRRRRPKFRPPAAAAMRAALLAGRSVAGRHAAV